MTLYEAIKIILYAIAVFVVGIILIFGITYGLVKLFKIDKTGNYLLLPALFWLVIKLISALFRDGYLSWCF